MMDSNDSTAEVHLLDFMNPPGVFINGARQKPWSVKSIPSTSGKLMPEFDKRRSIKDMFKKPALTHSNSSSQPAAPASTSQADADVDVANSASSTPAQPMAPVQSPIKSRTPTSPAASADNKRKPSDTPAPKNNKRSKTNGTATSNKTEPSKGQQSLKGFFAPKVKIGDDASKASTRSTHGALAGSAGPFTSNGVGVKNPGADNTASRDVQQASTKVSEQNEMTEPASLPGTPDRTTSANGSTDNASFTSPSAVSADGSVHDPIVSKESWSKLLRKPAAPSCEHGEPCKSMLTKKKGENQGRSFWMCQRPLGPSGNKERGSQWRCPTFIWCSDYKGDG